VRFAEKAIPEERQRNEMQFRKKLIIAEMITYVE